MKRVVITGIGAITAFGKEWSEVKAAFQRKQNAVQAKTEWAERYPELGANLGAEIHGYHPPKHWNRKQLRSLGRVSQFAVEAAERALADANCWMKRVKFRLI
ncbi:3-oxoacyl-[acyl-carrier-protein] synthase 2 [Aggregatibacter aphrophilus]|uniref:3-oxoacyl-[acyl-carrier-protein] synthase 2 n=1 Tax=Aggregatibacter aphrophilus TaxID=732 RepID=A0A336NDS2_AGGAP|nr:3-oxoacyl-[acyl-carrier-protein] synthase 2 [Aggregatibacter aphrophilus]